MRCSDACILAERNTQVNKNYGVPRFRFHIGERVAALAPHAEYVVLDVVEPRHNPSVVTLPEEVSFEEETFWPLSA